MVPKHVLGRKQLRRILALMAVAAVALAIAVSGLVAYSAQVIDTVQRQTETRLAERRVSRTLAKLREDVTSAAVWTDAYAAMGRRDLDWMQINFGDYYADYMHHEVTLAYDGSGRPVYASRDSEPVAVASEAGLAAAAAPLVAAVRAEGRARPSTAAGLDAVATREAAVMVRGVPYFISVSTIVRESPGLPAAPGGDPVVVSGLRVASFVPSLAADLGLEAPRLALGPLPPGAPAALLADPTGRPLGALTWTPNRPGGELLLRAAPVLTLLLGVMLLALSLGGWRIFRLVDALDRHEKALERSLKAAEAANAAKSQFLANMSHELRTPLNGIVAMAELLRARQTDPRSQEMAEAVAASGRTLEHVVNDILDVSKIEAGQMRFELRPFDLTALLHEVADLHRAAATAKGVTLSVEVMPGAARAWVGDRNRVSQVLNNLLSNAVKFTERGAVRLRAQHTAAGLRILVADTGVGFDRAAAQRLFQRFEQADVSVSRRFGGTGLGLSICHGLVELMEGRIGVRAAPGLGAVFAVHLPLPAAEAESAPPEDGPAAAPQPEEVAAPLQPDTIRILFADDHVINRRVVSLILAPLDIDLVEVEDGAQALAAFRDGAYDLILMDVQMPGMDGLTATREIRALEAAEARPRTPVIFLTANAMPDDLARSREAGGDLHIAKPVRPEALIAAIQAALAEDPALAAA